MITPAYVSTMAAYNNWQNRSIFGAADALDDAARRQDRGAFFRSIHGTLNHLLWGDQIWMSRFAGTPRPAAPGIGASVEQYIDWADLCAARRDMDAAITSWAGDLDPAWLEGNLTWFSGASGRELSRPKALLAVHFFNHQTHHRGQVHAMLTAAGARPDDTDLPFMPGD